MTWQLAVTGHHADPEEERAILNLAQEFVDRVQAIKQETISARFGGQYGSADLLTTEPPTSVVVDDVAVTIEDVSDTAND